VSHPRVRIVDLRFNGGGNEDLAKKVAARIHSKAVTYAAHRYRNGPGHNELSDRKERTLEARGPWTFEKPLAVLIGERTMSSAESFASMLAMVPGARLFGDRSAGSSGNPRELELPHKIIVTLPRWIDYDHRGEPLEERGVQPDERIEARTEQYGSKDDPVVRAALRWLRTKRK
jgi:C-terminal processing protease CtpA/Prc